MSCKRKTNAIGFAPASKLRQIDIRGKCGEMAVACRAKAARQQDVQAVMFASPGPRSLNRSSMNSKTTLAIEVVDHRTGSSY